MFQGWWTTDDYTRDELCPEELSDLAGPHGPAYVPVYSDGTTGKGWGEKAFPDNYFTLRMEPKLWLPGYERKGWALALVMRSVRAICIDIDGKNGGQQGAAKLGMLPHTLAETSKSGNGHHLFYSVEGLEWSDTSGFAGFRDRIGLAPGVDLRSTGCVFHYPNQLWNDRPIAPMPQHLKDMLLKRQHAVAETVSVIKKTLENGVEEEVLIMQDQLVTDLNKQIPNGKRNSTLFAIGSQMMLAEVPGWEQMVAKRATEVGLGQEEVTKLVNNIAKYGANA
jgi:hypothetical protein